MGTAIVTTTLSRTTGQVIKREVKENPDEVDSKELYRPLVEILYKDMRERGLIK